MSERIPQSVAKLVVFRAYLASDGKTPATGKTIAITISKNGATSFSNPNAGATNATEMASGFYKFTLDTTDTGTQGPLAWRGAHADIDDAGDCYSVVDAYNAGFAALPEALPNTEGGLPVLDLNGRVPADIEAVDGTDDDVDRLAEFLANLSADGELTSDNLAASAVAEIQTGLATSAEVTGLNVNTRANVVVPVEIETPDASTQVYKIRLFLFDVTGNMEAPDSTPTIALVNAAGTDRSSRLSVASNPSTGVYSWDYTATAGDAEEQLNWTFTVVESSLTRTYPATSYVVEDTAYRFSSSDRSKLTDIHGKLPSKPYLTGTSNSDGDVELNESTGDFNATQQTRIQTQAAAAITAYDPPTRAEATADKNEVIDAAPTPAEIDTHLSGTHGSGAWGGDIDEEALAEAIAEELGENLTVNSFTDNAKLEMRSTLRGVVLRVRGPVTESEDGDPPEITLVIGDDYLAVDGREIEFDLDGAEFPDLTDAVITLRLKSVPASTDDDAVVEIEGEATVPTGDTKTIRFEPTSEETARLTETGEGLKAGEFDVHIADADGHEITPLELRGVLNCRSPLASA